VFRAGHLSFPKKLANALDTLGYRYDCTLSTNDMGYSFPFPMKKNKSFSGTTTKVYEVGVTISDVIENISRETYPQAVEIWLSSTYHYAQNHSPVSLLIHPNRTWKLWAQQDYIREIGHKVMKLNTAAYGDYWRMREDVSFYSRVSNDTLFITIPQSQLPLDPWMSFMTEGSGQINEVVVKSSTGNILEMAVERLRTNNRMIIYNGDYSVGTNEIQAQTQSAYVIYPNPSSGIFSIKAPSNENQIELNVFDLAGKLILSDEFTGSYNANFSNYKGILLLQLTNTETKERHVERIILK